MEKGLLHKQIMDFFVRNFDVRQDKEDELDTIESIKKGVEFKGTNLWDSATPGNYELEQTKGEIIEQIIRPTGLLDPVVTVRPTQGQIDDLVDEIRTRIEKNERTLKIGRAHV